MQSFHECHSKLLQLSWVPIELLHQVSFSQTTSHLDVSENEIHHPNGHITVNSYGMLLTWKMMFKMLIDQWIK